MDAVNSFANLPRKQTSVLKKPHLLLESCIIYQIPGSEVECHKQACLSLPQQSKPKKKKLQNPINADTKKGWQKTLSQYDLHIFLEQEPFSPLSLSVLYASALMQKRGRERLLAGLRLPRQNKNEKTVHSFSQKNFFKYFHENLWSKAV